MLGLPLVAYSYKRFKDRFTVLEINDTTDLALLIDTYSLDFFYTQAYGGKSIHRFQDKTIWKNCKSITHCVFETRFPESDIYITISNHLNKRYSTNLPVLPLIVEMPPCNESLRDLLKIPKDAIVIGRYGGADTFNIREGHDAIRSIDKYEDNVYFLFMNTTRFFRHPRVIYLPCSTDDMYKAKFINTCDAMIHARSDGETFGLAVAEFSCMNKPVITCKVGYLEHIEILGDKAIIYSSTDSLIDIFKNIRSHISSRSDWNAYRQFSPEHVMEQFNSFLKG
jgi:glycosyltransferase involved in cell wall biosynthesis